MLFRMYAGMLFLGLFAAAMGVRIMFQLTPDLWERRPPLRRLLVVCVVAASLMFPAMFVARLFVHQDMGGGFLALGIGMGCAAVASATTTLVLMLVSR